MLTQYNLSADDVVYFEHAKGAIESAESVGIVSYFYDEQTNDLSALKQFLDRELQVPSSEVTEEGNDTSF